MQAGLTQTEFQQKTGLAPSIISHIEIGNQRPSVEVVFRICRELSVSPDWLLGLPKAAIPAVDWGGMQTSDWKDQIGTRLRLCRKQVDVNQANIAAKTGLSPAMISNLECGVRFPSVGNLVVLCRYFEVPAWWLLGMPELSTL